jgi:hypothetical protein
MARKYIIQRRDTLRKIARHFYDDPGLSDKLARYNGILNPALIVVGQMIEIPSLRELEGDNIQVPPALLVAPPNGLDQILSDFGNIYSFIREDGSLDPGWETEYLTTAALTFPIPLCWDLSKTVNRIYCHKKIVPAVDNVFNTIHNEGLDGKIRSYGGCFNFRSKRTGSKLSTHCWGIALDINPETNAMGTPGDMDDRVIDIFKLFGFSWGGDWAGRSKDPMHFQFCTGY